MDWAEWMMKRDLPAPFFERVYALVRLIPPGKVASYGQIAALLEHPRAARMVGWALHGLRDGTDVPWQRVVNAQGGTSTSSFSEPPDLQRRLLEQEGVDFDAQGCIDMQRFAWDPEPRWDPPLSPRDQQGDVDQEPA
jgi:methylated-DNA-protein-cysteine methyltransferase related protein